MSDALGAGHQRRILKRKFDNIMTWLICISEVFIFKSIYGLDVDDIWRKL